MSRLGPILCWTAVAIVAAAVALHIVTLLVVQPAPPPAGVPTATPPKYTWKCSADRNCQRIEVAE